MDIASTPILAQQLMLKQQQMGIAMVKANADQEKAIATILDQAIQAAAPSDGSRGTQLDIVV